MTITHVYIVTPASQLSGVNRDYGPPRAPISTLTNIVPIDTYANCKHLKHCNSKMENLSESLGTTNSEPPGLN